MSETATSIRVVIPLTLRKRNGRPKILPPEDAGLPSSQGQDPHVLRAIARAWKWRRQLEEGEASTLQDIAGREGVSERFIGRMIRLAYLAPEVLEALVAQRRPPAISINEMVEVAKLPCPSSNHLRPLGALSNGVSDPSLVEVRLRFGDASSGGAGWSCA